MQSETNSQGVKAPKANPLTIAETIRMARLGDWSGLSASQRDQLRQALQQHPSVLGFDGCEDALLRLDAFDQQPVAISEAATPAKQPRRFWIPALAVIACLLLIAAGFWWQRVGTNSRAAANGETGPTLALEEPTASPPKILRPPDDSPQEAPDVAAGPVALEPLADVPAQRDDKPPEEDEPVMRVTGEGANLVREPDGGFRLSSLNGSTTVRLSGKATRLRVGDINGEVVLDLSELQADELEFAGSINGNPRITAGTRGGRTDFRREVGGSAEITITAPGGEVVFHSDAAGRATISGGVVLKVVAQSVDLAAGVAGGARVSIQLTGPGKLRHGRLEEGGTVTYRKSQQQDPEPDVAGDASGPGRLLAE
jgi:hypothetical protein